MAGLFETHRELLSQAVTAARDRGYHVPGASPAGHACLTDAALVANRLRVTTTRHSRAARDRN